MDINRSTEINLNHEQWDKLSEFEKCMHEEHLKQETEDDDYETIRSYFEHEQWSKLIESEKISYRNAYNLYQGSLVKGIVLPKPYFMISNEENVCENKIKVEDITLTVCKEESLQVTSNVSDYNTCEEEIKFIMGCEMLVYILDNNIQKGTKDRAKLTLPKNLLEIKSSTNHGEGVFTLKTISKGIKFGPYEGPENVEIATSHAWRIIGEELVDTSEIEFSNWLRYVNRTRNVEKQNLVCFQYDGGLYYKSTKIIREGEELLVFYEEEFMEIINGKKYFIPVVEKGMENIYACRLCCSGFNSEDCLKKHVSKCPHKLHVLIQGIAQCPFCKMHLMDKVYLENHVKYCYMNFTRAPEHLGGSTDTDMFFIKKRDMDDDKRPFVQSTICNNKIERKDHLSTRLGTHAGRKVYECTICNKKFTTKSGLDNHLRIHTGEKPFQCKVCNKKFAQSSNLKTHLRTHSSEKPFECAVCDKKFVDKGILKQHLRFHTGDKLFVCTICNKAFTVKSSLRDHLRIHTGEKPFNCKICSRRFAQSGQLKSHLQIHTDERPFDCTICNKNFKHKRRLKLHLQTHTDEKPFECVTCNKRFTQKYLLKLHLRKHTGEKPFDCRICGKKYAFRESLRLHLRTHADKEFGCVICDKKFREKSSLKSHLQTHTDEKPFQCTVCSKRFTLKKTLNVHLVIHTGEKPFECAICNKKFALKSYLEVHVRTHSREKTF